MSTFSSKYGRYALVAGASEGLGAAFAEELAARGLSLVLVARRKDKLETFAAELRTRHPGIDVRAISQDLASPTLWQSLEGQLAGLEIGLLVYDTAFYTIGPFFGQDLASQERHLDVNCRGPLLLVHHLGAKMVERGRGGILLVSSLSGNQGGPLLAHYAATKAYLTVLAEGLWYELRGQGVDVLASAAGAIETANYTRTAPKPLSFGPPPMKPIDVARESLDALGKGPTVVPGRAYRFSAFLTSRLMPRRAVVKMMADTTRQMYGDRSIVVNAALGSGEGSGEGSKS